MSLRSISGIARPVDPGYATNRAIAVVTVAVIALEALRQIVTGAGFLAGGLAGILPGLAVFLAWAICRELDPDHDLSAFVAAALALAGTFIWGPPGLLALFWLLLTMRIVNRSTGLPATLLDSLGILALGLWLTYRDSWTYAALLALAFLLDGTLPRPNRRHIAFGLAALAAAALVAVLQGGIWIQIGATFWSAAAAAAFCVGFAPVLLSADSLSSVSDDDREPLRSARVRSGQAWALLAGVSSAVWFGTVGLVNLLPFWAAVLGAAVYWLIISRGR